jgi:hypothetical protein
MFYLFTGPVYISTLVNVVRTWGMSAGPLSPSSFRHERLFNMQRKGHKVDYATFALHLRITHRALFPYIFRLCTFDHYTYNL